MNRHRKATYAMRREILRTTNIKKRIDQVIEQQVQALASSPEIMSENFEAIVRETFPFDEPALDRLFDAPADKFAAVLLKEAKELYASREGAFTPEILRKVERDIYLQVLDNLWMQHLENMDHLREGIHWMSVGQQDPLVEYRRRGQLMFEEMQARLRHDVVAMLFRAEPIPEEDLEQPTETELTRAARQSISNANQIVANQKEFDEGDFKDKKKSDAKKASEKRKKAHKNERKRKAQARRRK
jgi:preprotein translocase subunit SecA